MQPEDLTGLLKNWEEYRDCVTDMCEVRLRRFDGIFRWFSLRREPLLDQSGLVTRWFGTGIDIEAIKQRETLHAAEKQTMELIADEARLKEVLDQLCSSIDVQVAPSVTTVLLKEVDRECLWHGGGLGVSREWISAIVPVPIAEAGLCGRAAFLKERVIVSDVATDPNWPDQYRDLAIRNRIRAAWSEPILAKDQEVLGTFALYSHESRVPTDEDLALIQGAGHIARIAIERQRSQESLRVALKRIENSETRLRQVIDTIPTLAWCNLADGPTEFLNKRWHEYPGLTPEESNGWGWQTAFHPDDFRPLMERWRELLTSGESGEIEARLRRYDGVYRWFLIRVEPFRDETGKLLRWYGTSTDIESLKQTEEKLREEERELRRITDAIPQAIVVQDPSGTPVYANQATLDYTGLTAEDVISPGFRQRIFHPDDLERLRDFRKLALARGLPFEIEQRALRKDGQYRWFLIRYNPFRNERNEVIRWYATGTDIDERVRAEERTRNENLALREQIDRESMFEEIVGSSEALRKVLHQVAKVALSDSTVLILGDTGTGKELIARAIHKRSSRADRAFIGVNCAAIPPSLIASELFGHEKGAFTGASQRRLGRFELANGGTIFLDEIGELSLDTQVALLRVLQEREFERVGGTQPVKIDVRIIAATNRDLEAAVANGTFRPDLYYRLNVFPIQVPPLRERQGDVLILLEHFVHRFAQKMGKHFGKIDKRTVELFRSYPWTGNIRELQNVGERSVIVSSDGVFCVDAAWLSRDSRRVSLPQQPEPAYTDEDASRERQIVEDALAGSRGRVSGPNGAAARLRVPPSTLEHRIKKLRIRKSHFKLSQAFFENW